MPRYPGGIIRKTPVTPAGPFQDGTAPGMWTLAEATYWQKQGLWPIAGNFLAVEDVFSTYLYTGTGGSQTITNGIDLSGKGGMVWLKSRSSGSYSHQLYDTTRGATQALYSNTTDAQNLSTGGLTSFTSSGFSIGTNVGINTNAATYASWTFREASKFFDVVTYTGDGNSSTDTPAPFGRGIQHSLGVKPGLVIIKRTDATGDWHVAAQKSGSTEWFAGRPSVSAPFALNSTNGATYTFNGTSQVYATETAFYPAWVVGGNSATNISGATYVAYLFAHDPSADGIIQCGSFTTDGSGNATVNLGWEPQWVLRKTVSSGGGRWYLFDTMRGLQATNTAATALFPNETTADDSGWPTYINSTGFTTSGQAANSTDIYIAIRRGPMRTPTVGTSVFAPATRTGTGTTAVISSTTFPPDLLVTKPRTGADPAVWFDRLRGRALSLTSNGTTADTTTTTTTNDLVSFNMNGITVGANQQQAVNSSGVAIVDWNFRRAPGFFDVVCYTGTGVARTVNHNLGVAPELMIVKSRSGTTSWMCYASLIGPDGYIALNFSSAAVTSGWGQLWNTTNPTASNFSVGNFPQTNGSGTTYVAYLFATCPGVSKVGSYTGNGSSQTINCGFSSGARFFLVKRTDSTGDWWVWDSARGITAPADPALRLNSTAAEVTSADATDPDNSGIIVNQETTCNINVNGATYIFLAIA